MRHYAEVGGSDVMGNPLFVAFDKAVQVSATSTYRGTMSELRRCEKGTMGESISHQAHVSLLPPCTLPLSLSGPPNRSQ